MKLLDQNLSEKVKNTFVIGGSKLYEEALNYKNCEELFATRVNKQYDCDTFINPNYSEGFEVFEHSKTFLHEGTTFDFVRYAKKGLNGSNIKN